MRKHIYHIAWMAASALVLASCSDFLEEESQSEVIPQTTDDFSELLIGSGYPDQTTPNTAFLSLLDDDCDANLELVSYDYSSWPPVESDGFAGTNDALSWAGYYTWQPTMCDLDGQGQQINTIASATPYAAFYQKIKGCNAVLDLIDEAQGTQAERDRITAEALAVRALLYFQLVNLYGEPYNYNKNALGVPLKLNADLDKEGMARATVGEVYEQVIVPDLQRAARLMDALPLKGSDYRVNQPAIHTLLSRVYLFMERYDDCISEANAALKQGIRLINLTSEIDLNYHPVGYSIFSYDNPEVMWTFGPSTWYYGLAATTTYRTGNSASFRAIWDQQNDLRWKWFGLELATAQALFLKPNTGLCQSIRTAETYLNKMEAEALLGKAADANQDLKALRSTRVVNYQHTDLSGSDLVEAIRTERRKEFCFEGFRWFDLRRYGMPQIQHRYREVAGGPTPTFTLKEKDPLYTLPLPSSLFANNTQLQQNSCRNEAEREGTPTTAE